jgi:hypothetical protein
MPYGSYQPFAYAPFRDEAQLNRDARAGGMLPKVGKNHQKMLERQLEKIRAGKDIDAVRARRVAEDNRINNQIEVERMQSVLRSQRMPGLRGEMGRQRNSQGVAEQVNVMYS